MARWEGFMKYDVEMGSIAMIYIYQVLHVPKLLA
jgi:hypothetical protein